jgi:AraC-like DNA-binding protein
MQEEELFTDTKLCIDDVALRLAINSKYLSQSINEEYNRNFYVYVNELRVEKAKTYLVAEPQANYSIEGIARQVGFQSKSSFYIAFKRSTGLTPTAYRAQA